MNTPATTIPAPERATSETTPAPSANRAEVTVKEHTLAVPFTAENADDFDAAAFKANTPALDLLTVSEGRVAVARMTRVRPLAKARLLASSALSAAVGVGLTATALTAEAEDPGPTGAADASWHEPIVVAAAITRMTLVPKILW